MREKQLSEMQCGHMLIANAQNADPELLQQFAAALVALLHSIVDGSIDFDDQIKRGAVEIDDEAAHNLLPAKLHAEAAAIAKQVPCGLFGWGR